MTLDDPGISYVLAGGSIDAGTVATTGGATLVANNNGGTFDGVTFDGTLDMETVSAANVTVVDGFTFNGTIDIGAADSSTYGTLNFVGAQTWSGTGSVVFGGSFENSITNASLSGDSGTLTIGSGITIDGTSGLIGSPGLPLFNQGTIDASESGDGIGVQGSDWTNSGTLEATNGGYLGLYGTWSNSGSITATGAASQAILAGVSSDTGSINASSSAQVFFRGTATLTGTTTFDGSGGTVTFEGTLDESGNTVTLDDPGISYVLAGGSIDAGTVATTGGATLVANNNGGTFDGVTFDGTLDMETVSRPMSPSWTASRSTARSISALPTARHTGR